MDTPNLPPLTRRHALAWMTLLVSLLLTVLVWYGLRVQIRHSFEQHFELRGREVIGAIESRMRDHEQILLGGAGLFDAQAGHVGRAAWRAYVERLNLAHNFPGIQGVGFSQLIAPRELAAHTAAVRAEGFPAYAVRPPGEREQYTSIVYLEPFTDRNLAAFGYDMMSEPIRAQAMRRAGESGRTAISDKVKLVQETHGKVQAGLLMYVPVYDLQQDLASPQARWAALRGFVYSPYRVSDLMRGILGERQAEVDFAIYDGAQESAEALMYDSALERQDALRGNPPLLTRQQAVDVYGQTWTIRLSSRPELETEAESFLPWLVFFLGLGISATLFVALSVLISRRDHAERLALAMTEEIRRNELRLQQSEARLTEAQRTAQIGNWELDHASGQLLWSDEIFRLFEIDRARFAASYEGFLGVVHPEDRAAVDAAYADSLRTREPYDITHRLRMADGRIKWVHERCSTDFDPAGKPLRSRGTVQDVTRFTDIQRQAQENSENLQAILDNVADGIITIDERGTVQSFNRSAEAIFGYAAREVVGRNVNLLMPEPYHSRHDEYLRHYRETGERRLIGIGREVQGRRRDGSAFPLDLAVSRSARGGQPLYIGLVRDITERKRIEKMKSEFVSTVSHELRTPLTSIRGALGLLTGGALGAMPAQAEAMLRIASNNTERLLLLINDILDMQKIESGQMAFRFENLDLMPFVRAALEDLASYGEQHGVRFVLAAGLEGARVYADKDRLSQVLANLLSNAAKFSPRGGQVEVAVGEHDDWLRLSVTDHGPGIPEEFQPKVFERFTQSDASDSRSRGGTGLGLAITQALVEKHGGRIGFDTRPGEGTTFHVDLPRLAEGKADVPQGDAVAARTGLRALVVEDDPDVAALVQRMLADAGYAADVALDAAQARDLLARDAARYRFMTLDVMLPGEDGISLLRGLRAQAATHELPVVVLSVKADEARLEVNGGAVGVVDWLGKPIDQQRLLEAVRQAAAAAGHLPRVLHVEDDPDIRQVVGAMLRGQCDLVVAGSVAEARERLGQERFGLVLLDIGLPDGSGLDLLDTIEQRVHPPQVVVFSAQEVPPGYADRVSAALLKSRTSDKRLLEILLKMVRHD